MADLYSTNVLTGVVQSLIGTPQFLLDRYFPTIQTETSEEIHFDVEQFARRVAPFVSPLVEGQIVASLGYITKTFTPAYIKDKRVNDMNRPFKRSAGEQFGGDMSPMARQRQHLAYQLQDQRNMIDRRLEVMAAQTLCDGKITIQGEKYPPVLVDFGRLGTHTVTASPLWSNAASLPLDDLANWSAIALQDSGINLMDVIMPMNVWKVFRSNTQVKDRLNLFRPINAPPTLAAGNLVEDGGVYQGNIDGFNIITYSGWWIDPADNIEKQIWPANKIALLSPNLMGVRAFGAIRDEQAGLQAMPYFPKSWVQEDPSVRYLLMQSAPLLVPYRVNASLTATVL